MDNFKVPGFLWVVLIAVTIVLCETFLPNPLYVEVAVVALMAIVKGYNLGTGDVEKLLELLRQLHGAPQVGTRAKAQSLDLDAHRPNKLTRWLLG